MVSFDEFIKKINTDKMSNEDYKNFLILLINNQDLIQKLPTHLKVWYEYNKADFLRKNYFDLKIKEYSNTKYNLFSKFFGSKYELSRYYRNLLDNSGFINMLQTEIKMSEKKIKELRYEVIYILRILFKYDVDEFIKFISELDSDLFRDLTVNSLEYMFNNIDNLIATIKSNYNNRIADFYAILFLISNKVFYCPEIDQIFYLNKKNLIIFEELSFENLYVEIPSLDSFNNSLISFRKFKERFLHTIKYFSEKIDQTKICSAITDSFIICKNKIINYKKNTFYSFWFDYFYENQSDFKIFTQSLNVDFKEDYLLSYQRLDASKFLIDKFLLDISNNCENYGIFILLGGVLCQFFKNKLFLLIGSGANGKSVLINIINNLFDKLNLGMNLDQFSKGNPEFIFYKLYQKLVVTGSEPGKLNEEAISVLKRLHLSNEYITARRPYSSKSITFIPHIISIFAMNSIPFQFYDSAFERRLFIIVFERIIEKGKRIENLDRLIYQNPKEMSRFFAICYSMFQEILKKPSLLDQESEEIIESRLDPISDFCSQYLELSYNSEVEIKNLYETYKTYCIRKAIAPLSRRKFVYLVRSHFGKDNIQRKQRKSGDERYYILTNLRFIYDINPIENDDSWILDDGGLFDKDSQ